MTQEIIEMAKQAGMAYEEKLEVYVANIDDLQDFAKLVEDAAFKRWAAQTKLAIEAVRDGEREACAKVCEEGEFMTIGCAAEAIRARGQE